MQWYQTIFELIDMRSFSNLWYWLGLSIFWSTVGHWVIGVPHDMLRRAGQDAQVMQDVETLAAIYIRRLLYIARTAGLWMVMVLSFILTVLLVLSVHYGVEFAQAVLCLLLPGTLVFLLNLRTARIIETTGVCGPALLRRLRRHRHSVQAVGMVSIFVTGIFGMYQNLLIGVYG